MYCCQDGKSALRWERFGTSRLVRPGPRDKVLRSIMWRRTLLVFQHKAEATAFRTPLSFSLISPAGYQGGCSQMPVLQAAVATADVSVELFLALSCQASGSGRVVPTPATVDMTEPAKQLCACFWVPALPPVLQVAPICMGRCSCSAGL